MKSIDNLKSILSKTQNKPQFRGKSHIAKFNKMLIEKAEQQKKEITK